jgi:DNA modification methylase
MPIAILSKKGLPMNTQTQTLQVESWPVDRLLPYARNARTHSALQVHQIAASIAAFGFNNPVLADPDGGIIAGHGRVLAARDRGLSHVPVIVLSHLSENQKRAFQLADNQLALNAGWDLDLLRLELKALTAAADLPLDLIGFDEEELARLLAEQDADEELADPDAVPASPRVPVTLPGDLWILGDHRLLCGDATRREAFETVLAGGMADMVFTDPPYNVAYEGKTAHKLTIQNDALGDKFYDFLREASANLIAVCPGAIYICMSSSELHTLYRAFTEAGGHWSTFVIWSKHHFTLGRSDYQRQYEPILYGWPKGVDHYWCGDRNQSDVWFIARPMANREHPTAKPVELVERAVENSSQIKDTVLDPFAGSGTTLIACQRRKRRARLIELDPSYADVTCQRWQQFTGKPALLEGDGRTFAEIAQQRRKKAA